MSNVLSHVYSHRKLSNVHAIKNQVDQQPVQNKPTDHNTFMFNIFEVKGTSEHMTK